jgi:hypothetical protein
VFTEFTDEFTSEDIALNRKLVAERILANPENHEQAGWIMNLQGKSTTYMTLAELAQDCGTAACVAGWAVILTVPPQMTVRDFAAEYEGGFEGYAREALGLSPSEAAGLFYGSNDYARERIQFLAEHPEVS